MREKGLVVREKGLVVREKGLVVRDEGLPVRDIRDILMEFLKIHYTIEIRPQEILNLPMSILNFLIPVLAIHLHFMFFLQGLLDWLF